MALARRIVPLLDRVLIEKVAPKKTSAGGILLPESVVSKLNEGKVLAVGPGARGKDGEVIPPSVSAGDTVVLPEYGGSTLEVEARRCGCSGMRTCSARSCPSESSVHVAEAAA